MATEIHSVPGNEVVAQSTETAETSKQKKATITIEGGNVKIEAVETQTQVPNLEGSVQNGAEQIAEQIRNTDPHANPENLKKPGVLKNIVNKVKNSPIFGSTVKDRWFVTADAVLGTGVGVAGAKIAGGYAARSFFAAHSLGVSVGVGAGVGASVEGARVLWQEHKKFKTTESYTAYLQSIADKPHEQVLRQYVKTMVDLKQNRITGTPEELQALHNFINSNGERFEAGTKSKLEAIREILNNNKAFDGEWMHSNMELRKVYDASRSYKTRLEMLSGKMQASGTWKKLGKATFRGAMWGAVGSFVGYEVASHIGDVSKAVSEQAHNLKVVGIDEFHKILGGGGAEHAAAVSAEHADQTVGMDQNVWHSVKEWFQAHGVTHPSNALLEKGTEMITKENGIDIVAHGQHVAGHMMDTHMLQGTPLHHMENLEKLLPGHAAHGLSAGQEVTRESVGGIRGFFENNPGLFDLVYGVGLGVGASALYSKIRGRKQAKPNVTVTAISNGTSAATSPSASPSAAVEQGVIPAGTFRSEQPEGPKTLQETLEDEAAERKVDPAAYVELMQINSGPVYDVIRAMGLRETDAKNLQNEIKQAYQFNDPDMLAEIFQFIKDRTGDKKPDQNIADAVVNLFAKIYALNNDFFQKPFNDQDQVKKIPQWLFRAFTGQNEEEPGQETAKPQRKTKKRTTKKTGSTPKAVEQSVDTSALENFFGDNGELHKFSETLSLSEQYSEGLRNWADKAVQGQDVEASLNKLLNLFIQMDEDKVINNAAKRTAATNFIKSLNNINPEDFGKIINQKQADPKVPSWFKMIKL